MKLREEIDMLRNRYKDYSYEFTRLFDFLDLSIDVLKYTAEFGGTGAGRNASEVLARLEEESFHRREI